jgi:hypothetical protein
MHNPNPHPYRPAEVPPSHQGKFVQILDQAARAGRDSVDLSAADLNALGQAVEDTVHTYIRRHKMPISASDALYVAAARAYNILLRNEVLYPKGVTPDSFSKNFVTEPSLLVHAFEHRKLSDEMRKSADGSIDVAFLIEPLAAAMGETIRAFAAQRMQGQAQGAAIR